MKRLVIEPLGWTCTLVECPPGLFTCGDVLGFKSVHPGFTCVDDRPGFRQWKLVEGTLDVYLADDGGHFHGDSKTPLGATEVQPCESRWEEYDE